MNASHQAGESPNPPQDRAAPTSPREWIYPDAMPPDEEKRIAKALESHFNMNAFGAEVPVPAKIARALAPYPEFLRAIRYTIHYALVTPSRRPSMMRLLDTIGGGISTLHAQISGREDCDALADALATDVSVPHNWGTDPFLIAAADAADAINGVTRESSASLNH